MNGKIINNQKEMIMIDAIKLKIFIVFYFIFYNAADINANISEKKPNNLKDVDNTLNINAVVSEVVPKMMNMIEKMYL
jgi:hypothetical protein